MKTCPFCGSNWTPRVTNPVQCPRCKRVLPEAVGKPVVEIVHQPRPEWPPSVVKKLDQAHRDIQKRLASEPKK